MGHRHVSSTSYMFETENDQRWNLTEHPYAHIAQSGAAESSSLAYPANNMSINGEQYTSNSSLTHNPQNPHHQQDAAVGPSNLPTCPENYGNTASSSNYNGTPVHEDDSSVIRGSNRRWNYKRKSPDDTNRYNNNNDATSSSDISIPTDPWEETPNMETSHTPWDYRNVKQRHEGETSVRGTRSINYIQRSVPTSRASSSSSLQLRDADEDIQLATESYSSPHPRPTIAWRSSDRNVQARMSIERYRSSSEEDNRPTPEGLMIVDRSAFGSRNLFDHQREMRLDIDDMSYEELLALGERIGSVSTGLSEGLISKCLRESIYCSSNQIQEEGKCVICLEEYVNMDDVGMLKGCKHDFHVGCIKKWLSMKNLCPICKSEPMKHN